MTKPSTSGPGSGAGPTQPAAAVEETLRQRTAELETALCEAERISQSLRESEAQFRSMARNSLLGISLIVNGKYAYTNPAQNEILGYSADEMLLLDPLATIAPSDRGLAAEMLRQALVSEIERAELTLRAQRKDGTLFDVEISGSAMLVNGERSLIVLTKDITSRTAAEQRLRESEETLRTVADSARDAIVMINDDGQITFWNHAAESVFGYSSAEVIGQELHTLLAAPQYRHSYREPFARFRKTGKGKAIGALRELSAVRKDGAEFPIELSLSAVKLEGNWNAVGIVRDISERKLLERSQRERADRTSAQTTALDEITAAEKQFNDDPEALFRAITEQVARATGVERASVWLFNAEETQLHCLDLYEFSASRHSDGAMLSHEQFSTEFQALKSASHVAADDALTDARTRGYAETYLKPLGISAMLDSVVELSGTHLGLLCLEHVRRTHHWEDDEIAFASQVAARIGLALLARSRLQAERAMRESERRLSSILDNVELISIMLDHEARLTYCNDYLLRISGWQREEIIGRRWEEVFRPVQTGDQMRTFFPDLLADRPGARHHESRIVMRNGELRTIFWNNTALRSPDGGIVGAASVGQDITERKQSEEELQALQQLLREQAIHDPLTGLYNRRYMDEVLARELIVAERKGRSVSAIMGDLDHFKLVNDRHGHRAGDEVLRTFGALLKANSRGSDIDCRYGGEEFLLLLPDMNEQSARARAETLRVALASTPVPFEGSVITVTGSFGVACFPKHARTGDNLIAAADKALYAAKEAGRNRVVSCSDLGMA